jgi:hypothetical protein
MLRLIVVGKTEVLAKQDAEWTVSGEVINGNYEKKYEIESRAVVIKATAYSAEHPGPKPVGDALLIILRTPADVDALMPALKPFEKMPLKFVLYDGAPANLICEGQLGMKPAQKKSPADFAGMLIQENNKFVGMVMKVFKDFDKDGSGFLDLSEIAAVAKELGTELSEAELALIMQELDVNKDKKISMEEFVEWWKMGRQERTGKMGNLVTDWLKKHKVMESLSEAATKFAGLGAEEHKLQKSSFAFHVNRVKAAGILFEFSVMTKGTALNNEFQVFSGANALAPDQPFFGLALGAKNPKDARSTLEELVNAGLAMAGGMIPKAEMVIAMVNPKFGETNNKAVFTVEPSEGGKPMVAGMLEMVKPFLSLVVPDQSIRFFTAFATDLKKIITEDKPVWELLLDGISSEIKSETSPKLSELTSKAVAGMTSSFGLPHHQLAPLAGLMQSGQWISGGNGEIEFEVDQELKDLIKETIGPNPFAAPLKDLKAMIAPQAQEVIGSVPLLDQLHKLFKEQVTSIEFFFYVAGIIGIKISLDLPGLGEFLALP